MDFTRQPIIETVITAKEGCKLVVRSSKGAGQEEYFVDAVEVVSFGNSFFFRSQEKPKSFLVPASDYEILEVREARMVLKNVGFDRTIKIGGGKETQNKAAKEQEKPAVQEEEETASASGGRVERKRDRRRSFRRRRRGDEPVESEAGADSQIIPPPSSDKPLEMPEQKKRAKPQRDENAELQANVIKSLLPPPPNLISDTIEKYKDNKLFEGVFINKEESEAAIEEPSLTEFENFEVTEADEEEIVKERLMEVESFEEDYAEGDLYGNENASGLPEEGENDDWQQSAEGHHEGAEKKQAEASADEEAEPSESGEQHEESQDVDQPHEENSTNDEIGSKH